VDNAAGRDELHGYWSVEHGFHTAMEDECLMFRPDGTGWYEYSRPWYRERTVFRRRLDGEALIVIEAHLQVVADEANGRTHLEKHAIDLQESARYALAVTARPLLEQPVRELSLELSFALGSPFAFVTAVEPEAEGPPQALSAPR
jgi:hypothetical protein